MKNYLNSRKITITALLISVVITIGYFVTMIKFADILSYGMVVGILKPLGALGMCATVLVAFFLFFPQVIFTSFLKRVVSWYLPILFYLTATTSIYSSHIMSVDRSVVVLYGMVLLGLIAVVYAFAIRKKLKV